MKSLVTLFAASLLVLVLLGTAGYGTDKSLRSPSRGLSESTSTDVLKEVNKATTSTLTPYFPSSRKNKKGNKGKKGKKGKKGNKGNKGNMPTLAPTTLLPTDNPTPAPTPASTLSCLNDDTFRIALDAWFSDPTSATSTYGNITDW